jgi:hypothetical protein
MPQIPFFLLAALLMEKASTLRSVLREKVKQDL